MSKFAIAIPQICFLIQLALEYELALAKHDNAHKAELLAVYNYFTNIKVD